MKPKAKCVEQKRPDPEHVKHASQNIVNPTNTTHQDDNAHSLLRSCLFLSLPPACAGDGDRFGKFQVQSAVLKLGIEKAKCCVQVDPKVPGKRRRVEVSRGSVRVKRKNTLQHEAIHRLDGDRIVNTAEMEPCTGGLPDQVIAFGVHRDHTSLVNGNVNPFGRRLNRAAKKFFKFSI